MQASRANCSILTILDRGVNQFGKGEIAHCIRRRRPTMPCTGRFTSGASLAGFAPVKGVVRWRERAPFSNLIGKPTNELAAQPSSPIADTQTQMKHAFSLFALLLANAAQAIPISYAIADSTNVYGSDFSHLGSTVVLSGNSESIEIPLNDFSFQELTVGSLTLTASDPLSRNLPTGFSVFPYSIGVDIAGVEHAIVLEMHFNADHSNDSFFIQGGTGIIEFLISPTLRVDFQFLSAGVASANAGETKTGPLRAQFYGRPISVAEPTGQYLMGFGSAFSASAYQVPPKDSATSVRYLDIRASRGAPPNE